MFGAITIRARSARRQTVEAGRIVMQIGSRRRFEEGAVFDDP